MHAENSQPNDERSRGARTLPIIVALLGIMVVAPPDGARRCMAYDYDCLREEEGNGTRDRWNAVAIDQAGDLVTAGVSQYGGYEECAFWLAKTERSSGAILWRRDMPDCGFDEVYESSGEEQVLIDPAGDVVVGRRDIGLRVFAVHKFSGATGEPLWRQMIGRMPKHGPFVHAVALDAAGNVFTAAGLPVASLNCCCLTTAFVVTKLDGATGAELWRQSRKGTFIGGDECEDEALNHAVAVAVDGAGDVIASGTLVDIDAETGDPYSYPDYRGLVLKLSGQDGAEIWQRETSASSFYPYDEHRLPSSLGIDAEGDVLIAGTSWDPHGLVVEKLSGASGARLWRHVLRESAGLAGLALTIDSRNDVAATGTRSTRSDYGDIVLFKLAGDDGSELWKLALDGTRPGDGVWPYRNVDQPWGVAATAAGRIVLVGQTVNATTDGDFLVAGFDGGSGEQLWRHQIDGTTHGCEQARALAIDAESVVAVGFVDNQDTGPDAFTLVLTAATGDETWRTTTSGPLPADQVCQSPDGNPCGSGCHDDCATDQPVATSSTTSTITTTTATDRATTSTLPADSIDGDCDDGDPCTTSDRLVGGDCIGTIAGAAGFACRVEQLAAGLCDGERLSPGIRRLVSRRLGRTMRLVDKAIDGGTARQRTQARRRLQRIAGTLARRARKRSLRRRLSAACLTDIDGLVATARQLGAQLER